MNVSGLGGERALGTEMEIQPRPKDETFALRYRLSSYNFFTPVVFSVYHKRERNTRSVSSRLMFIKHYFSH